MKQEIAATQNDVYEKLRQKIKEEMNNHYRKYSLTIEPGTTKYLPYEPIKTGSHPGVFVRTHHPDDKFKIEILEASKQIIISNLNREVGNDMKELAIVILILKAKVTI